MGCEYRLTPSLSVGIALNLTPLFDGSVTKTTQIPAPGSQSGITTTLSSYSPASTSNFETFFGLTARYTITF